MTDLIHTEEDLEERLSRPSPEAVRDLSRLKGDLVILGVGGKMGPTLARMARRAIDEAGLKHAVIGVARFSDARSRASLESAGVRTVPCDLLDRTQVLKLPDAAAVISAVGQKFGTTGAESATWATNAYLPGLIAERYRGVPTMAFSTGNVYPLVPVTSGGATEELPPGPVGEYAQSALGRERMFEYVSRRDGTPTTLYRLNYAVELRYGILLEIALKVWNGTPLDVRMGYVNVLWQGDANAIALRMLFLGETPPRIFNVTGMETLSVRDLAGRFGELLGRKPVLEGKEADTALLSNASRARDAFGPPRVGVDQVVPWVAHWVRQGGRTLNKPSHFETRDGKF
ncbi:MAG TPA: NAD-dependent epimerase/dehydratase family protein [Planctomycetota bacterium]|nr:NAD-dependent epimerase/dehydratase family protein [Planctomycetota bacterium]